MMKNFAGKAKLPISSMKNAMSQITYNKNGGQAFLVQFKNH